MPTTDTLLAFFMVSIVLGLTPGPDNLFVLLQSAIRGRRAGVLVMLGLCTGLLVHTAAVALGLAALFAASAAAFTVLKLLGAAYLVYLAWQAFRAPVNAQSAQTVEPMRAGRMYARGILMNLTNPKVAIFFLAFLPQFADPSRGPLALQILALGAVFIGATMLVFSAIAYFSGAFGVLFQKSARAKRILNIASGTVFLGLAAKLATSQR